MKQALAAIYAGLWAAGEGRLFLWLPVALGVGIVIYFALPFEPTGGEAALAALAGALAIAFAFQLNGRVDVALCLMLGWGLIGFSAATLRTALVGTPILPYALSTSVIGTVQDIEPQGRGAARLVVRVQTVERMEDAHVPHLVRIKLRRTQVPVGLRPGDQVSVRARLLPLPEPVMPGGFDFGRTLFFKGIGATGFAFAAPEILPQPRARGFEITVNTLRLGIARRIEVALGSDTETAAIATALLTGYRGGISEDATAALRGAGLAHLLAISGLHLGLVSGALYFFARLIFAAVSPLALRYPVRKWAAAIALIGAFGYFLISGMSVATFRAMIMTGLVLIAILVDRQAISLRLVALAAFGVLLVTPESLMGAGFHMSFAAVLALVAVYESLRTRRGRLWQIFVARGPAAYMAGLVLTSVVAGIATGMLAAFHFGRVAMFTLLGNIAAVPVTGFVIMPFGLLGLIVMPLGGEGVPLRIMGWGIDFVHSVAARVSALPGAEATIPAGPPLALGLMVAGGLIVLLLRGPYRMAGLVPVIAAMAVWHTAPQPDVLIERDIRLVAVRNSDSGALVFSSNRAGKFSRENWLRADGVDDRAHVQIAACDKEACIFEGDGFTAVLVFTLEGAVAECGRADIVITPLYRSSLPAHCRKSYVIDKGTVARDGAQALYISQQGGRLHIRREGAGQKKTARPWAGTAGSR